MSLASDKAIITGTALNRESRKLDINSRRPIISAMSPVAVDAANSVIIEVVPRMENILPDRWKPFKNSVRETLGSRLDLEGRLTRLSYSDPPATRDKQKRERARSIDCPALDAVSESRVDVRRAVITNDAAKKFKSVVLICFVLSHHPVSFFKFGSCVMCS